MQRAVSHIDPTIKNSDEVITAKVFKDGHSGLLTTNFNGTSEKLTTHKDSYKPHMAKRERERGAVAFCCIIMSIKLHFILSLVKNTY